MMDAKRIKVSLKEAKEAIKNKDVEKALKLCKAVLTVDRKNYLALVIFGAALQESTAKNEAPNAYKKAIEISPDQILAWQGLASYYEKVSDVDCGELLSVYKHLLLLEKELPRKVDICEKIAGLLKNVSEGENIEEFASLLGSSDSALRSLVLDTLYKFFSGFKEVPELLLSIYKKVLLRKIEGDDSIDTSKLIRNYLDVLRRQKDYTTFLVEFERLFDSTRDIDLSCVELLCDVYCELSTSVNFESNLFDISGYCDTLLSTKEDCVNGLIAKGVWFYGVGDYVRCRDILSRACEICNENWLIYYHLSAVYLTLHCFSDAVTSISLARNLVSADVDPGIVTTLEERLLNAQSRCKTLEECERCVKQCTSILSSNSVDKFVLKCLARAAITLAKWSTVEETLAKLTSLDTESTDAEIVYLKAAYTSSNVNGTTAICYLKETVLEEVKYVDHWLLLGELCWEQGKSEDALDCFLKAANLAPQVYKAFLYLGHYYRDVNQDLNKSRRCYQKAFQLNPRSDEVGIALSDVYRKLGSKESNFDLLSKVTAAKGGKWAWLRLGLHYLDSGDAVLAVTSLRSTVRTDPNDSYCWELLGDALSARGSFASALKCYQKSLQLNSTSLYASLQIAAVKQRIGLHDESIKELRQLVVQNQSYVPALKGLAEVCLSLARDSFDRRMLDSARDLCEEAVTVLTEILKQKNNLICVWQLLADACILVCRLPEKSSYLRLPSFLFDNDSNGTADGHTCGTVCRDRLLDFSLRCYAVALQISENSQFAISYLWHDIACCYDLRANFASTEDDRKLQRRCALAAARKSVSLNSKSWEHWNLLGVIASSKEINKAPLAQHCFIRAVELESNSAMSWSNLGLLYLQLDDIQLANEAFQAAQRADPKYPRSWIGQAMIAESVGHDETADLFYHSTVLGYHQESAKGFAEWICKILKDWDTYKKQPRCYYLVKRMYGVQVAVTVLTWYTAHYPDDACATNMLAVLLELCNLNRNAVLLSESSLRKVDDRNADVVCSNLGRQLRKTGEYEKAIAAFQRIKEIDFSAQCDFALTLFLAGQYEEALSSYESAIHWLAPDDGYKAQVMVAIAALHYLRNEKQEAQTILLECTRLKPTPVYGLFAACAFGMLNKQLMLSKLVLKELEAFKNDKGYTQHVALFNAYCEVFQGNFKLAIKVMSKFVYNHPGDASVWLSLCFLLLHLIFSARREYTGYSAATAYHARCAILLGRGSIDISKICSIVSLSYLLAGKSRECLRSSLKAVFLYPNVAENWAVLIAVEYSRGTDYPKLKKIIAYVREKLICSKALATWLSNVERKVTVIIGK